MLVLPPDSRTMRPDVSSSSVGPIRDVLQRGTSMHLGIIITQMWRCL